MNGPVEAPLGGSAWSRDLDRVQRLAMMVGLCMGIGTPLVVAGLLAFRMIPAGRLLAPELVQQVGYLFTGMVFLAATWSLWRRGKALSEFREIAPARRPAVLLRETLLPAALSELSCLLGLAYWILAGEVAGRHCWGFILLTPLLFFGVVPREARWRQALEG